MKAGPSALNSIVEAVNDCWNCNGKGHVPSRRTRRFGIRTSKPTRSPREMVVEAMIGVMVAVAEASPTATPK